MPFIDTKTNATISQDAESTLRKKFGEAIATLPGKSEEWLMLSFTDGCRMAFRGRADAPVAMVEVKVYGRADDASYARLTKKITEILGEVLHIPANGVYVKYEEVDHWGYNGSNF